MGLARYKRRGHWFDPSCAHQPKQGGSAVCGTRVRRVAARVLSMTRVSFRSTAVPEPSRVRERGRVLWPGMLMPLVGFLGAAGLYAGVVLIVLHPGAQNPKPGLPDGRGDSSGDDVGAVQAGVAADHLG
jgi:hypothetical protein